MTWGSGLLKQLTCHPDNTYLLKERARISAEYAKLDHEHGQVDFPINPILDFVLGSRTHGVYYVSADGYVMKDRTIPMGGTAPVDFAFPEGSAASTFKSFTAAEAGLLISTEEGMQSLDAIEGIKKLF
ncbi:hypothetical protein [Deminuibacter soli]|uniref:Uncharacterized protein n=1 Tax=Deminuibacter soli TaxID=2291815 RepID=A0A3E1NJ30_9BACT|nr:hypothetical protein [Deminuibacter soli]RFM27939.1 hypothetical protein DXN05_10350 [Deminuibacter soli]